MQQKMLLHLLSFFTIGLTLQAQVPTDTLIKENQVINEVLLIKDQQQKQIDSLVKIQLNRQLDEAIGNKEKTKVLEDKLRQIAISDSLRTIAQAAEIKKLKKHAIGYPVILNQDTLFQI